MRRIGIGAVLAVALAVLTVAVAASGGPALADRPQRVALLVGNNAYDRIVSLRTAVNDARVLGEILKKLGFTVTVMENLSQRAMSEALLSFDKAVRPGDTAFFFFAGHGFELRGENFLLPTDVPAAVQGDEELVRDASFPAQRIVDRLQARGARTAILVLDACRDNPFARQGTRGMAGTPGLAAMTPAEGVFVLFSAGAKQSALDRLTQTDPNPNSVFTRVFAKELPKPGATMVQVAKRTQSEVRRMAASVRHEQTPAYYDQVVGDVVLNGSPEEAGAVAAALPAEPLPPQVAARPLAEPPPQSPTQLAALPVAPLKPKSEPVNAPIANFMRHNTGWSVSFSFAEPATAISWRLGDTGPYKETGFLDVLDQRTRKRMPNPSIELDAATPATIIEIRYLNQSGELMGPFPVRFDPTAALERGQRGILESTAGAWVAFREYNGLLLYFTHLVSYRCAIRQVRFGIDTTLPDRTFALPPCDQKDPAAIPGNAQIFLKLPPSTQSVSVELTYRDGSVSELKTFRR
jgi:hypothetical protein